MATPSTPNPSRPAIAVLGTGRMGAPIAHNLIADGFELGRQGAVASLPPGSAWIHRATIGQEWTERLATVARTHQIEFVDAPVTEALALRWQRAIADGHADEDLAAVIFVSSPPAGVA